MVELPLLKKYTRCSYMRIFLDNKHYDQISFNIQKFNHIIAPNGYGKSTLLNNLKAAFEGKEKHFLLDGNKIEKDYYDVYYIGEEDNISNEATLGSKSYLKQNIKYEITSLSEEDNESLKQSVSSLEKCFKELLTSIKIGDIGIDIKLDTLDLIMKNANVVYKNNNVSDLSYTNKRIKYIDMMIDIIAARFKPSVLLIDEPFSNLSERNKNKLLRSITDKLRDLEVIVFICSSDKCVEGFKPLYVVNGTIKERLLTDEDLYKLISHKNNCSLEDAREYTEEEELKDLENMISDDIELMFINITDTTLNFECFPDDIIRNLIYNEKA